MAILLNDAIVLLHFSTLLSSVKLYFFIFVLSFSPLLTCAQTITLSRGKDAVLQGFSELILRKAYQEMGIELQVIHVPIARSLHLANNGEVDGEVSKISAVAHRYPNLIKVPVAINHIDIRMFAYNQKILAQNVTHNFARIGCVRGVVLVEKIINELKVQCNTMNNYQQAIHFLNQNKLDVLVLPLAIGIYFKGIDPQFSASHYSESLGNEPLFHYLHKKHRDLVPELTSILQAMEINIYNKTYKYMFNQTLPVIQ